MKKLIRVLVALLSGISAWSCGESTAPTSRDVIGRYEIVTVNAKSLPLRLSDTLSLVSSSMDLLPDNSYRETITYDRTGREIVYNYSGVFVSDGSLVVVETSTGQGFNLSVANKRTLIENDENGLVVYVKR